MVEQIIKKENSYKDDKENIKIINGSPFSDDVNNDYKAQKIGEIQNFADQKDKLIILQNLDQIQPYLYDLYNMNYKIIDDKKYVRICLDNFSEQLIRVNDTFKIIVLVDKKFVNKTDMAFLNRLEKMQLSFNELLDDKQKELIDNIIKDIRLKDAIKNSKMKFNYDLNNSLINCNEQDIRGLIYYLKIEAENKKTDKIEQYIKERIYDKITILLPEDLVIYLDSILKEKYFEKKKYYNFQQYLKALSNNDKNLSGFKISIIYTFSNITNTITGYNNDATFMISEINKEEKLEMKVDEIKQKKLGQFILIKFEDFNSNKMQFTADYINNKYEKDDYHYIFIIYLSRNFESQENESQKSQKIYSIPNIYDNINQLFIDNLEGPEIALNSILNSSVKEIMFNDVTFSNLDKEFKEILIDFVFDKFQEKSKLDLNQDNKMLDLSYFLEKKYGKKSEVNNEQIDGYSKDLAKYLLYDDVDFKNAIISKAKELIESQGNCFSLINKMLSDNYINENRIDLISTILDYIKENVFSKYLKYVFNALEDNNLFTTLLELNKDPSCRLDITDNNNRPDNSKIINDIKKKFLNQLKYDDDKTYEPKFKTNYRIPGFYNFYKKLSIYLNKNITNDYLNNEKKLRNIDLSQKTNITKEMALFHENEENLLQKVLKEIEIDKLYYDLLKRVAPDLILRDYIIYYLENNLGIFSKVYYNIISKLLFLRFSDETNIIKNNEDNPTNIIFVKIMWIESNSKYIESILKAFEFGKDIYDDNTEGLIFYQNIVDSIVDSENPIKYIPNKLRPEHTREINECFYIFLAGLCLNITTNDLEKREISIGDYCGLLKDINKLIKNVNDDLGIYLNELYIIDELIQIIEYNPNAEIKIIIDIRNYLTENAKILQKNNNKDEIEKNINNMNASLAKIQNKATIKKYYMTLKYVYKNEIQKINDKNYSYAILDEIIKEKEIIKISKDILQILLGSNMEKFENLKDNILNSKDIIIDLLDIKLDSNNDFYIALSDTLLYFFEKNSLIYLKDEETDEEDSNSKLNIFKECISFFNDLNDDKILKGNKYITMLFCIGYIKSYCYTFINNNKKDFDQEKIIKEINENKMVRLYIYKIIFNKNNKQINAFLNSDIINKYKLDLYEGFKDFIKPEEIKKLEEFSINKDPKYKEIYTKLDDFKKSQFEKPIKMEDISVEDEINFDAFYLAAYKLILINLTNENFEQENSYINFYKNICIPLFDNNEKLKIIMEFIFNKEKYLAIKKEFKINSEDINALLYGYRYCLNEISEECEGDYLYSYLYKNNNQDFDKKYYPGNDYKDEPYYEIYNQIVNHFNEKPDEGCYVCLCEKGYYHSTKGGFPGPHEVDLTCPKCGKDIGAKIIQKEEIDDEDKNIIKTINTYEMVKRDKYYRIFKDDEQIEKLRLNMDIDKNFDNLNYMTLEQFKKDYILPLYSKEKGLNVINIDNFKKENRIIRNLSQLSYRLLNYILYCHLFFAKLYTRREHFDRFLPKGMTWFNMIKLCYNLLILELEKKRIDNIEIFMNCVFSDLFKQLNERECITKFQDLIEFEDELEKIIQNACTVTIQKISDYKEQEKKNRKKESAIALLNELYDKSEYDKNEYPYYEFFYYADYLDEQFIKKILKDRDESEYPVLSKYLNRKKVLKSKNKEKKSDKDKYSLDNLNLFNKVLNLFNDKYSNQLSRLDSERQSLKESEIFIDKKNSELINKFIKLYNSMELEDKEGNILELSNENKLCDFLLISDNKYGQSYISIYNKFIEKQNKELEDLLDKKISSGEFNSNCKNKVSVQQIKENEIFVLNKKSNFIDILFNSSYRKFIDTQNYDNYNQYEIDFKQIEEQMTNSFLKNKKMLNDNIMGFIFDNEVFSNEMNDIISDFKYKISDINDDDKVIIYDYVNTLVGSNDKFKKIINSFIALIKNLNKRKKENENKINDTTKICDIDIVKNQANISIEFKEMFKEKNKEKDNSGSNLIVGKITNIFDFYLKLIYKYVKQDIQNYQEKKEIIKKKETFDEFFNNNQDIKKEDLASAIRIFITLILYRENEKDKKIKSNKKNICDYLKNKDLWDSSLYNDIKKFENNLSKIRELNIKIKEILYFYYYLIDNEDEGFEVQVKNIKKRREESKVNEGNDDNEDNNQNREEEEEEEEEEEKEKEEEKEEEEEEEEKESDKSSDSDDDSKNKKKKKGGKKDQKKKKKKKIE